MFGLGMGEILLIAALVLVVVGPERLPEMMKMAGKGYAQLRRAADDLRRAFVMEADRMEADERLARLEKRRKEALEAKRKAQEEAAGSVAQATPLDAPAPAEAAPEEAAPDEAAPDEAAPDEAAPDESPSDTPRGAA